MTDCSRRTMLGVFFGAVYGTVGMKADVLAQQGVSQTSIAMERWIELALHAKSIDSPLYLGRFKDPTYFLLEPISWTNNFPRAREILRVTVPKGFVTDLASIPPIFYSWLRPDGNYAYAAIIHDYLYWQQDYPREQADNVFRVAMEDLKVDRARIEAIYEAVSRFGQQAWDENRKSRQQGERRILIKYPPTADVTWEEWKKQPDVLQ